MRALAVILLLAVALAACRTAPQRSPALPRYVVTAAPLAVGVVSKELCIGVDPADPRGVWWWEPGASAIGVAAAVAFGGVLTRMLFAVAPRDAATLVAAPLVLGSVALVACLVPARRATRVDPSIALRIGA